MTTIEDLEFRLAEAEARIEVLEEAALTGSYRLLPGGEKHYITVKEQVERLTRKLRGKGVL